jgi:hypothetical protein
MDNIHKIRAQFWQVKTITTRKDKLHKNKEIGQRRLETNAKNLKKKFKKILNFWEKFEWQGMEKIVTNGIFL